MGEGERVARFMVQVILRARDGSEWHWRVEEMGASPGQFAVFVDGRLCGVGMWTPEKLMVEPIPGDECGVPVSNEMLRVFHTLMSQVIHARREVMAEVAPGGER